MYADNNEQNGGNHYNGNDYDYADENGDDTCTTSRSKLPEHHKTPSAACLNWGSLLLPVRVLSTYHSRM